MIPQPSGAEASQISTLLWWMTAGSLVIWAGVVIVAWIATRTGHGQERIAMRYVRLGTVGTSLILAVLLVAGLIQLPPMTAHAPSGSLKVSVYGEQWWWRFRVEPSGGPAFETANELWLPVEQPVEFVLRSNNVIHSFWIPSLAGKVDLIPGRVNHLTLHPTRTGRYRGMCAEFCGVGHAHMALEVNVVSPQEFTAWVNRQIEPSGIAADGSDIP